MVEEIIIPALPHFAEYIRFDDLLAWAWKGAAINTDFTVQQTFKLIAQQLEKGMDS
jgi:hypothetical protein